MKRASIVAAFLMLLFAISPQPAQSIGHTQATPTVQHRPTAEQVSRHTRSLDAQVTAPSTVLTHAGDTYGRWATLYCGNFNAWPAIQTVNGWPERRIPVGARAVITCQGPPAAPAKATPAAPVTSTAWMHPLASGRLATDCYHSAARPTHGGVDMPQVKGTAIRAVSAGDIYRKAFQPDGAGYYLVIRHPGNVFTLYMHMIAPSPLATGTHVTAGQTVGQVGATGNATGPHLHFEVHQGGYGNSHRTNPASFMRSRGVNIGC